MLVGFARAAYRDDGNTLCALTTPSEQQSLVAQAGFSGSDRYSPCPETLQGIYKVFLVSRPARPLSQIVANWSRAPIHIHDAAATLTVMPLATGPPFPAAPATITLALLDHGGHWLVAVPCSQLGACNRFPASGDAAAVRAVVTLWQLTGVGYGHSSSTALCSILTPALRKAFGQLGREMTPARVGCTAYVDAILVKLNATKPRLTWARVKADLAAEVIHVVGNNATVGMRNLDFGGSSHWIVDWINGHWLLATTDA